MKPILKAAMAGLLTAAIAGGGLLGLAGMSFAAASAPSWEPDANAAAPYGNLTFYDANGDQVTSGSNLASPFAYAVAGTAADTGATKATLYYALPRTANCRPSGLHERSRPDDLQPERLSGGPADIDDFAPTYPVVDASSANITSWLTTDTPDTTTGYDNTIQVRTDRLRTWRPRQRRGTYWESDIGYNTTSSPITVDGTTVPADGWAVLFPFVSATTTSLTTSATGGHLNTGDPITLTATVVQAPRQGPCSSTTTAPSWPTRPPRARGPTPTATHRPPARMPTRPSSSPAPRQATRPALARRPPPSWAARPRPR